MIDDFDFVPARFEPVPLFERFGMQRVFYKGDAPKQEETAEEKALAQVASEKWARYQSVGVPAQDKYIQRVNDMRTDGANQVARGHAASATMAEFTQPTLRTITQPGVNPGRMKAGLFDMAVERAKAVGDNAVGASLSQEDAAIGGLQSVVEMGQGQSSTAQAGMSDLASAASAKASDDAVNKFNDRAARLAAVGTLAGAAGQGYMNNAQAKKAWFKKSNAESGFAGLGDTDPFA